jgi:hypothetical protein
MNDRFLNKVRVIQEFPGFDIDDVLILNKTTGLFEYSNKLLINNDIINNVYNAITDHKPMLSKKHISEHFDYYFEDISEYQMKDKDWVLERIERLKTFIKDLEIDEKNEAIPESVDVKESKTVWQNVIWEYETLLGMRKLVA